jgi:N-acetylneuraminate synthase/N,N'-diacetyllegionaminate synthase
MAEGRGMEQNHRQPTVFGGDDVLVIAEIGGNHEGSFDKAKELVELAAAAGAGAVKLQIYSGDTLVSRAVDPERNRHFQRFALSMDQYLELAELTRSLGVMFMASVWDRRALEVMAPLMPIFKIGSGDLTAYELVEAVVGTGKPIIQSCGLATIDEIAEYVELVRSLDASYLEEPKLCLLQCTVMYPIPDHEANLNAMCRMGERFGLPVGYSDHTVGTLAAELAVAMGARVIELHFTDTREGKSFRDHQVSVTREELAGFLARVGKIKELQGSPAKQPTAAELEAGHLRSFRRALYAARDLESGTRLSSDDVISLRPNVGIDGRRYREVLGRRLRVAKREHEPLEWDELEP